MKKLLASLATFIIALPVSANAVGLQASTTVRAGFSVASVDSVSYDGKGYNAFTPFASFTSNELLQVNSIAGNQRLEFHLLSEVAWYDGNHIPGVGNQFGVINSKGEFVSALGLSANPGSKSELTLGEGEITFGLNSPEGLFSSKDSANPDKLAHMVAMRVVRSGTIFIPQANLFGASLSFNLFAGDLILFNEDLLFCGNKLQFAGCSDFDYNDMVTVVRGTPVPEPMTMLLLGSGLLGAARLRRKQP